MTPTIDAELEAAKKARDKARAERLEKARALVAEFFRLAALDPAVAGLMLDALPRKPERAERD